MKVFKNVLLICLCSTLVACNTSFRPFTYNRTSNTNEQEGALGAGTVPGVAIGGSVGGSMDSLDRVKFNRALDKAPGTATTWVNENNGINYTVVPIKKVTVNGNAFCREYQVTATKGANRRQSTGTACVASDGAWSEVH